MTMSLSLNLVLTATLAALMWTLSDAHPLEASNDTIDVELTCSNLEQVLRGRDGAKGEKGDIGSRGGKGDRGGVGPSGPQGVRGALGPRGPVGPAGPQGAVGEKGDRGPLGPQGALGPAGLQGPQGRQGPAGPKGEKGTQSGVIYTRWGRSSCPSVQGTELVYSGKAGGTRHEHSGGAANYLCMPNNPNYRSYRSGTQRGNDVYGAEYTTYAGQAMGDVHNHDAPCAVCFASTRGSVLMIPAKTSCPAGWTEEYDGYLMSESSDNSGRTMYICVDESPESVPGQNNDDYDRVELFMVEAKCEGLSCPPYNVEKELTCVVCTR